MGWMIKDLGNVLLTNEMHNSYNQFLLHSFLSAVHVLNESSHSSSGAWHNCASHWSLIHYNMMHGTHNIKFKDLGFNTRRGKFSLFSIVPQSGSGTCLAPYPLCT